jgi:hypothetical protein
LERGVGVGEVEPVEGDRLVVVGAGPPRGAGHHLVAAQCHPRPLGTVLAQVGHRAVVTAGDLDADEAVVGHGQEQVCFARDERAYEQVSHEIPSGEVLLNPERRSGST